jgi:hypothetical protein
LFEYLLRFIAGGIAVSAFAALGDALRPKSFAGLFGAAPSIALATLLITLSHKGAPFASVEGRSMILGAFALAAYSWSACLAQKVYGAVLAGGDGGLSRLVPVAFGSSALWFSIP